MIELTEEEAIYLYASRTIFTCLANGEHIKATAYIEFMEWLSKKFDLNALQNKVKCKERGLQLIDEWERQSNENDITLLQELINDSRN